MKLKSNIHKGCVREEEHWRQKSRSLWLQAREKNTSYFHKQAHGHRQFNTIKEIQEGDRTHNDFPSLKAAAHHHFKDLFTEEGT